MILDMEDGRASPATLAPSTTSTIRTARKLFPNKAILLAYPSVTISIAMLSFSIHGYRKDAKEFPRLSKEAIIAMHPEASIVSMVASCLNILYLTTIILSFWIPSRFPPFITPVSRLKFMCINAGYTAVVTAVWAGAVSGNAFRIRGREDWTTCTSSGCSTRGMVKVDEQYVTMTVLSSLETALMASITVIFLHCARKAYLEKAASALQFPTPESELSVSITGKVSRY
ncbi:unnamed protein product [Cyclocybe aegerita]|uniref:Uncharacterized protein n=1 Tax=Cyclocybe aegerita TaxID=1973307 RepID=A0A8S0XJ91_CYCAE|nr:unnamed protein product [Cyclocybe aegerita]